MHKAAVLASVTLLALAGCGKSAPEEMPPPPANGQAEANGDTGANGAAETAKSASISQQDTEDLRKIGSCVAAWRQTAAQIDGKIKQGDNSDAAKGYYEGSRRQAAIFFLLSIPILNKYERSEAAMTFFHEFAEKYAPEFAVGVDQSRTNAAWQAVSSYRDESCELSQFPASENLKLDPEVVSNIASDMGFPPLP